MSKLIAIEASSDACSVALVLDDVVHELHELAPRGHAQRLLPMINQLLAEHSMDLVDLDAIAFGRGPGSFTGLRIAAGVTQGLAFGADLPVIGVSTLEALVKGAVRMECLGSSYLPVIDARMEEVYCSLYRMADGNYQIGSEEIICKPDELPFLNELKESEDLTLLGSGGALLIDSLDKAGISILHSYDNAMPHAQDVGRIAQGKLAAGELLTAEQAIPVYLRGASAWKKRDQQKA